MSTNNAKTEVKKSDQAAETAVAAAAEGPKAAIPADKVTPLPTPCLRLLSASVSDRGNRWRATVPSVTSSDHPGYDAFWSGVADKLAVGDIIEVIPDDAAYFLEAYVYEQDSPGNGIPNRRVSVAVIRHTDMIAARRIPRADEYAIEMRGDLLRWCAVEVATGRPVFDKCYDRAEADEKLRAFLRTKRAAVSRPADHHRG